MSSQRDQLIKQENGERSEFDPLDESVIEGHHENEEAVVRKRKFKKIDEDGEDIGWTHEYEETVVRELKNFPCLWDTSLATFSKRNVCDPARKHIVFMLKQNHPNASVEIHEKLFTPQSVGRKIRNLRLAYKKIWLRDGFNAKWRHFRNLAFLQSSSSNMDSEMTDREYQFDESCYDTPFVPLNCNNDESPHLKAEMHSLPLTGKSPDNVRKATTQHCRCHPVLKFAQSIMDQLNIEQQKKFTIDVTKLLLKYQENNLV
ncbi:hypothetical protein Bhyg_00433 [Pseudolycoriella hygida]|uniref:MADF domain-containing protein n=1 Tax=Pseudolycoriella hygida TaxID=35572 RepID=A0A9Q0N9N7_9DIPT|nr:hypothetical protein Bhyg_00433 [Pseudolycoriella hygida]